MSRLVPMLILVAGLGLAAASGARNGDAHVAYRRALWTAANAEDPAQQAAARAIVDAGVPLPAERLSGWIATGGPGWALGVMLIVVGAVMARRQQAAAYAGVGPGAVGAVDFPGTIDALLARLRPLEGELAALPEDDTAPAVRALLDALTEELIEPLVDGRGQLVARHGIGVFAEYFGPFSSGERQLNRVWSALTDGHVPTAREALADAMVSLEQARRAWDAAG